MDLLANDLSVHEQFHDVAAFREAFSRLMSMRNVARRYGRDVHCHRTLLNVNPTPDISLQQAIMGFPLDSERRAAMMWLTRTGPFWDDIRQHAVGDWLECGGEIVTDSAVGEAAFRTLHGVECSLVSLSPTDWNSSPVEVIWCREAEGLEDRYTELENWWNGAAFEDALQERAPPIQSWEELRLACAERFENLIFAEDCFEPLVGVPFSKNVAERFLVLLDILEVLSGEFDVAGARTEEGHRIYRDYFTGDRALFSDSSDREKRDFRQELTFAQPEDPGSRLFCSWHGKVSRLTLRLHFSWPIEAGKAVYVVYAGPKITKR